MLENLTNSDQQNLLYLILLLVFLLSTIFQKRFPLSQALKYMAWWSVIIFVGVILYSYRFEFSDLKTRFLTAANPTKPRLNDNGQLVISLSNDGHFFIDLRINNIPMQFMIDTGASDIVIDKSHAQKIGININNLVFNKRYETANGESFGASIILDEVQIGEMKFQQIPASVNSANLGTPLLGMSFLRKFKKYEFYQDRLVLTL